VTAPRQTATHLATVLADVAKLKRPVTAAAAAATIAAAVSPFGLNVGPDGALIVGALTAIGVIAGVLEQALHR
jgi:hypothetical protein